MNKTELVASIAIKAKISKKDAELALNAFVESVEEALVNGEKVSLVGFGTFSVAERAERKGRNPQSGEEIIISAKKSPKFKSGKGLKEAVN